MALWLIRSVISTRLETELRFEESRVEACEKLSHVEKILISLFITHYPKFTLITYRVTELTLINKGT